MQTEVSNSIVGKINRKGWSIYPLSDQAARIYETTQQGPLQELKYGKRYILFPTTRTPTDIHNVERATRLIVLSCGRFPFMTYNTKKFDISCFELFDDHVMPYRGEELAYDEFLEALDMLTPTTPVN